MVERLRGSGQHYRNALEEAGVRLSDFSALHFLKNGNYPDNGELLEQALENLARLPVYDFRSVVLMGVVDTQGRDLSVLLVPRNCPNLLPNTNERNGEEMPSEEETHVVTTWHRFMAGHKSKYLVLSSDESEVRAIAQRLAATRLGCFKRDIGTEVRHVSPQEFVEEAKQLMQKGVRLPRFILRFDGLMEFARERAI